MSQPTTWRNILVLSIYATSRSNRAQYRSRIMRKIQLWELNPGSLEFEEQRWQRVTDCVKYDISTLYVHRVQ